jgi:hypothetical protein
MSHDAKYAGSGAIDHDLFLKINHSTQAALVLDQLLAGEPNSRAPAIVPPFKRECHKSTADPSRIGVTGIMVA